MSPKGGLRRSLISAIATTIGALILALLLLEDPLVDYRLDRLARQTLEDALDRVEAALAEGAPPDAVADLVGAETGCRITFVDDEGRPTADTGFDPPDLDRAGPIVRRALLQRFLEGHPVLAARDGDARVAFRRIGDHVVQVAHSTRATEEMRSTIRELLIVGGVMALLIALLLTAVLSRTLVEPARELTRVASALADGDLSVRTHSRRHDELGEIGRALDRMAETLAERIARAREEQGRLRTILNSMVEAVFVTDSLGRIVQTNEALEQLVEGDPRGRTVIEAIPSKKLHEAVRQARKGAHPAHVELKIKVGGEKRSFSAQVAPLPDQAGVIAVLHDVTSLKQLDRIRRDFVANASHELRTPLTAIRGFSETLRDGALEDPQAARRFVDVIIRHTLRLQALVDDLAALSRAESPDQELELGPVDVEKVIGEVIGGLLSKASERDIQLVFEPGRACPPALANERGLDQVLINLVDNAIKYSPKGSWVRVRTASTPGTVAIEVHNPGPPIKPKHQKRLFERFYRVDKGRSRDEGGTGLGLAIVKHLCTAMNGHVTVESSKEKGTIFRVVLPRADRSAEDSEASEDREASEDGPAVEPPAA